MKKYRLKEEVKNQLKSLFTDKFLNKEQSLEEWKNDYFIMNNKLEEVEEKIKLMINKPLDDSCCNLRKVNGDDFTEQEKELCEKALNGELFTKDDIENPITVIHSFEHWYYNNTPLIIDEVGLDGVCNAYRKYLKEKK